jgi:nucleoside-diphosphate-sugar epimerase
MSGTSKLGDAARVSVVGGAGYLGSVLCDHLLARDLAVVSVDTHWFGEEPLRRLHRHPGFTSVMLDARQIDALAPILRGCDAVVSLIGLVGDRACQLDVEFTRSCNYQCTVNLAQLCKRLGIPRFVFASSCSVYGRSSGADVLLTESSSPHPVSYYAQDKLDCENALRAMADQSFHPTILRMATLFGWSHRMRFDLIVNLLTAQAYTGQSLQIYGGCQRRPFLHVKDAAVAIADVLRADLALVSDAVFNVGSDDNNHRIIEIGELVGRIMPSARINVLPDVVDHRDYQVSFSKIARTLRYAPATSLTDGIIEIQRKMTEVRIGRIDDPIYVNEKRTQQLIENGWRPSSIDLRNGYGS